MITIKNDLEVTDTNFIRFSSSFIANDFKSIRLSHILELTVSAHNIHYAIKEIRKVLESKPVESEDIISEIKLHNNTVDVILVGKEYDPLDGVEKILKELKPTLNFLKTFESELNRIVYDDIKKKESKRLEVVDNVHNILLMKLLGGQYV